MKVGDKVRFTDKKDIDYEDLKNVVLDVTDILHEHVCVCGDGWDFITTRDRVKVITS